MSRRKFSALAIILLNVTTLLLFPLSTEARVTWRVYSNSRFGYSFKYPAHFEMQEAPENNDGRAFKSPDGLGSIIIFGSYNVFRNENSRKSNIPELKSRRMKDYVSNGAQITYHAKGDYWFVISGYEGVHIFYEKTILSRDLETLVTLIVRYPAEQKEIYDLFVREAASTMRFRK